MKRSRVSVRVLSALGMAATGLFASLSGGSLLASASGPGAVNGLSGSAFCGSLGTSLGASQGASMACFGAQPTGTTSATRSATNSTTLTKPSNVDAANPHEDVTPSGVQAYGQSETSVAALGSSVIEAWNDATGFFVSSCDTTTYKEELTGWGLSSNGGSSFVDEGGLPNSMCSAGWRYYGDPSVETWKSGGNTYFYVSSLFLNTTTGASAIAMDACQIGATPTCSGPYIIATGGPIDFLDKDFLSIDPSRGRLYATFTRFCVTAHCPTTNGQIELAVCDLTTPASPTCYPGASPAPYLVVQPPDSNCENEGAYPAVDVSTGDVYVAWEYNWATNFMNPACYGTPTAERLAYVPFTCLHAHTGVSMRYDTTAEQREHRLDGRSLHSRVQSQSSNRFACQ